MTYKKNRINLDTHLERRKFIQETESGIYSGTNEDGETVVILLQQNEGMVVRTIHHNKPNWFEVIEYNAFGGQESVSYEFISEKKGRLN